MDYTDIHGWFDFEDVYDCAVNTARSNDILVELGAWFGKSTAYMARIIRESGKNLNFVTVDLFKGSVGEVEHRERLEPLGGDGRSTFMDNMHACGAFPYLRSVIVEDTASAAQHFEDGSIHFVFVDASHLYENVKRDIAAWRPKMNHGGIIAGHDYADSDVRRAVDEAFGDVSKWGSSWLKEV